MPAGRRDGGPAASSTLPCPSPVVWAPPAGLEALAALLGIGFERAAAGMALLDLDGRVVRANRPMRELLGRSAAELAGRSMLALVRREDRAGLVGGVAAALASGEDAALHPGHRCVLAGRERAVEVAVAVAVTVLRDGYGEAHALLAECHDLTGHAAELERAERDRRGLLRQLVTAQEDERRRLAANLHDDTIQALAAALLLLDVLDARVERAADDHAGGGVEAREVVRFTAERVRQYVEHGLQSARTFMFDLRPSELDEAGLESALRRQLGRLAERAGCAVELHWTPVGALDPDRETILFRAVQEALANVARHAGATSASIRAWREGDMVAVEVADDGAGFDPGELARAPATGHLGLRFMVERIEGAGGTLRIDAAPGKGTRVGFRLPAGAPPRARPRA